ncbi:thioredoxin domain-containing protein [Gordonia sp. X0973]|uniref:DsbA family protein n=1 Tax=Gordonia sp. X0973 TaxID=2742602 RepID=UPI000F52C9FC|nr:thioredoxin domain-containing protein [Gordonia sp. X0973]QKT08005.1 thioredoxin domain-containing protein [Gordonia sp. X0973]
MSAKSGPAIPNVRGGYKPPKSSTSVLTYVLVSLAVIVVAGLVIGGVVWNANRTKSPGTADPGASTSFTVNPVGPVTPGASEVIVGSENAPTVEIFEDALCPACGMFEQSQGATVVKAIQDGKLRVHYRMLNFLNQSSPSGDYSTRAGAALLCVAGEKKEELLIKFHTSLFNNQPEEGGKTDHSNLDLARLASEAGATEATQRCIASGAQVGAAEQSAKQSLEALSKASDGQVSTPSVVHNGKLVPHTTPDWITKLDNGGN